MTHSTQIISLHSSQGDYTSLLEDLGEGAIRFQNLLIFFWIFDKGRLCLQIFLQPLHMIPTDILPMEYGGTNGCLEELAKFWKKEVEASQDWLKLQVQNISILYFIFLKKIPHYPMKTHLEWLPPPDNVQVRGESETRSAKTARWPFRDWGVFS